MKWWPRSRIEQTKEGPPELPWNEWLPEYFPAIYYKPFASHHTQFWSHIETIEAEKKPSAYFLILARGGGKDANCEGAVVRLGSESRRRFCLYVRATQDLANKTVQSIAVMLEADRFSQHYPEMANRQLTKYGHSRGWKMDLLRCASGFNVMGLGLDVSVRGLRLDELRPDLIILSDIDDRKDSADTITKKVDTITGDILPAGSDDVAVIGIQNLMHQDSIFRLLASDKADFLLDRKVNGPIPAINDLVYEETEAGQYRITNGVPTWPDGQSLEVCQNQINEWGPTKFRIESQHEVDLVEGGMYEHIDYRHTDKAPDLIAIIAVVDPAVTDNDNSDSQAIQIDGLGEDENVYRLYSFEGRESPGEVIIRVIVKALEYGADTIGFETDQGGDLWEEVYYRIWDDMAEETEKAIELEKLLESLTVNEALDKLNLDEEPNNYGMTWDTIQPDFVSFRAGSIGSKKHRGQMQVANYEKGLFIHVRGTSHILETALGRFSKRKPFDLHDAGFWSQHYLLEEMPVSGSVNIPR